MTSSYISSIELNGVSYPIKVPVENTYNSTSTEAISGQGVSTALTGYARETSLESYELISKPLNSLSSSGTIYLDDNTANKISLTGSVTFSLPSISDTSVFHQILVQLYMPSAYTISLGTSYYFGGTAPDMSTAGYYTLLYEYDSLRGVWVVGAVNKAS